MAGKDLLRPVRYVSIFNVITLTHAVNDNRKAILSFN